MREWAPIALFGQWKRSVISADHFHLYNGALPQRKREKISERERERERPHANKLSEEKLVKTTFYFEQPSTGPKEPTLSSIIAKLSLRLLAYYSFSGPFSVPFCVSVCACRWVSCRRDGYPGRSEPLQWLRWGGGESPIFVICNFSFFVMYLIIYWI